VPDRGLVAADALVSSACRMEFLSPVRCSWWLPAWNVSGVRTELSADSALCQRTLRVLVLVEASAAFASQHP
jgi:hypothetical protein